MQAERVYLVGMPASGKSTWGKKLAMAWRWEFVDLDEDIERAANQKIPQIFSEHGEDYFRKLEREAVLRTKSLSQTVIATGGGAPYFFDNMDFINAQGISVFLDTTLDTLLERLQYKANTRPLFPKNDLTKLRAQVRKKYRDRRPFYQKAHLTLSEATLTLQELSAALQFFEYQR
ncbi:MAG: shikimate kinase [Bacteroidota bacterium]